jgi:deoxyribonuclease-4
MSGKLLVGAHMSIAGGIYRAFEHGLKAGCRTIQIFLKNSNQWRARPLTPEDRNRYVDAQAGSGIAPVLAHGSYLINLAAAADPVREKSLAALIEELERANFLGVTALILHPGAHTGTGESAGIAAIAAALDRALAHVPPPVSVLLENTAGMGSSIGHRFEQLAAILERVRDPGRVGFCLDTCHLFAAGYDISSEAGYHAVMEEFQRLIGLRKIRAFHLNDSLRPFDSRVDRHAHIGQGFLGLQAFRCLMNDRRFSSVPKILETPKDKDLAQDIMNLRTLRSLVLRKG